MIASPMRSIQTVEACLTPLTPVLTAIKSWFTFLINLELIILGSTICETARSLTASVAFHFTSTYSIMGYGNVYKYLRLEYASGCDSQVVILPNL